MDDEEKSTIEHLIMAGALEVAGVSEDGEPLYTFTSKLKEVMPALYREHVNYVNTELMGLWEKGFITMNLFDDNPMVNLSLKAFDESEISQLSEQDQFAINEIKRILLK